MVNQEENTYFAKEIKPVLVQQNVLSSIITVPFGLVLLAAGAFIQASIINEELSIWFLLLSVTLAYFSLMVFKFQWNNYKLPLLNIISKTPSKIVWVCIEGVTTTTKIEIVPILKMTSYYISIGVDTGKIYRLKYPKDSIIENFNKIIAIAPDARFGGSKDNQQWFKEKYNNRYNVFNKWYFWVLLLAIGIGGKVYQAATYRGPFDPHPVDIEYQLSVDALKHGKRMGSDEGEINSKILEDKIREISFSSVSDTTGEIGFFVFTESTSENLPKGGIVKHYVNENGNEKFREFYVHDQISFTSSGVHAKYINSEIDGKQVNATFIAYYYVEISAKAEVCGEEISSEEILRIMLLESEAFPDEEKRMRNIYKNISSYWRKDISSTECREVIAFFRLIPKPKFNSDS